MPPIGLPTTILMLRAVFLEKNMINTLRAYLKTEGKVDYRECQIAYYTYSMFETPNKYKVNVNVHVQSPKNQYKKTLSIDSSFDNESEAINFAIEEGKKYIDVNYESGKINFEIDDKTRVRLSSFAPTKAESPKQQNTQKKDQK